MNKIVLMPEIQAFIDDVEKNTETPLYELSYEEARAVLRGAQNMSVRQVMKKELWYLLLSTHITAILSKLWK